MQFFASDIKLSTNGYLYLLLSEEKFNRMQIRQGWTLSSGGRSLLGGRCRPKLSPINEVLTRLIASGQGRKIAAPPAKAWRGLTDLPAMAPRRHSGTAPRHRPRPTEYGASETCQAGDQRTMVKDIIK
jgi:hypothetical protein